MDGQTFKVPKSSGKTVPSTKSKSVPFRGNVVITAVYGGTILPPSVDGLSAARCGRQMLVRLLYADLVISQGFR
jgi:hypothetical protein